jgi:hypothetical protein
MPADGHRNCCSVDTPAEIKAMQWQPSPEILMYYQQSTEATRLKSGPSQLEFARTKEVIGRWLGHPPAVILDIGGSA